MVEIEHDGNRSLAITGWEINRSPVQVWMGVAYRNPIDEDRPSTGKGLAVYRMVSSATGEIAAVLMRDSFIRGLFNIGQKYALSEMVE